MTFQGLGNSDKLLSVPLRRTPAYSGAASSVSGNVVSIASAAWSANQFVYSAGVQSNRYYLLFTSGAREGMYYAIASNTTTSLTVDLAGDSLSGLSGTESFQVVPFWTFGTLFPSGSGVSASSSHGTRVTEILVPNQVASGVNIAAEFTYYYFTGSGSPAGWRRVGGGLTTVRDDDVILPDSYLLYRQNSSAVNTVTAVGSVPDSDFRTIVGTVAANTRQDNFISYPYPVAVTLSQSGLFQSGAFEASTSHGTRKDELIVFNNDAVGKNKSGFQTYYYFTGSGSPAGWRMVGGGLTTVRDSDLVIKPGEGFIIRKAAAATPSSSIVAASLPYGL